ncbi:hypothetical protein [Streptomyces rubiginosohelvolus]
MSAKRQHPQTSHAPASLAELVDHVQLQNVMFLEVRGRRDLIEDESATEVNESSPTMTAWFRAAEGQIEVRCRTEVHASAAHFVADAVATFSVSCPVPEDSPLHEAFTDRVGVAVVYPYLRESVHQSALKLGVEPPLLSLIARKLSELAHGLDGD